MALANTLTIELELVVSLHPAIKIAYVLAIFVVGE